MQHILFTDPETIKAPAEKYLEPGTMVERGFNFHTIMPCHMHALNEKGKTLLRESQERYAHGEFKAHFKHWTLCSAPSGSGVCDDGSKFLNSFNNLTLHTWRGPGDYLRSSAIVMLDPDRRWCVTFSGSMYSLNPEGEYKSEYEYSAAADKGELDLFDQSQANALLPPPPHQPVSEETEPELPQVGVMWGPEGPEACLAVDGQVYSVKAVPQE